MKHTEPTNHEDILDLETLKNRKDHLENLLAYLLTDPINLEALSEFLGVPPRELELDDGFQLAQWVSPELEHEEGSELQALRELFDDIGTCAGRGLIADSYFIEYAIQTFKDVEGVRSENDWPYYHIDWGKAAADMREDYKAVSVDREDYWIRS